MSKGILIPILGMWIVVMVYPVLMRAIHGENPALLQVVRSVPGSEQVLFVFDGIAAPGGGAFWRLARGYKGDIVYVQYGHDGCAMDKYCQQVVRFATVGHYRRIDVLGISIGAETFPTIAQLFSRDVDLRLYGVCPFGPELAYDHTRNALKLLSVMLVGLKILLGAFGEVPFLKWNGDLRSPSELVEQEFLAAWGRPLWREWYPVEGYPIWRQLSGYESLLAQGYYCRLGAAVVGFVLAEEDEYVDAEKVRYWFEDAQMRFVRGRHARLTDEYVEALGSLGLYR